MRDFLESVLEGAGLGLVMVVILMAGTFLQALLGVH